jgi:hypothetical protein
MMTVAAAGEEGIRVTFADRPIGTIPFRDISEVGGLSGVKSIELPNPYELVVTDSGGAEHQIPWDFARHYCDRAYRPRVEVVAERGRLSLGERVREMRTAAGMTQARWPRRRN